MIMKSITVFTPAFNRAGTLERTYRSLLSQTCKDFVWLVVDDGSTDNTSSLVRSWIDEGLIEIRYIYRPNGGMHQAHNTAYRNIDTELNVCIDSDDFMPENAIADILECWRKYGSDDLAGIIGLDMDSDGKIIGTSFPPELERTTLSGYYRRGGRGDKKLVYRTDVIRKYPEYPSFEGERYVGLNYLYNLIDLDYEMIVLDKPLVVVEYQQDGSTCNMFRQYWNNPNGWIFYRRHQLSLNQTFRNKFKICAQLISHSLRANKNPFRLNPYKILTFIALPAGLILFWINYLRVK